MTLPQDEHVLFSPWTEHSVAATVFHMGVVESGIRLAFQTTFHQQMPPARLWCLWEQGPLFPTSCVSVMLSMVSAYHAGAHSLSCVRLFETPWTIAGQAHLSMRFSRQECYSRLYIHRKRFILRNWFKWLWKLAIPKIYRVNQQAGEAREPQCHSSPKVDKLKTQEVCVSVSV